MTGRDKCVGEMTVTCHRATRARVTRCRLMLLAAVTYVILLVTLHGQLEAGRTSDDAQQSSSVDTKNTSRVRTINCSDILARIEHESGDRCQDVSDIKRGEFKRLPTSPGEFFYSAFVDDRVFQAKFIRVIALLSNRAGHSGLYCHMPVTSSTTAQSFISTPASYYEMCENHGKPFGGWILSCALPEELQSIQSYPCYVVLSKRSTYRQGIDSFLDSSVRLVVERINNTEIGSRRHHFGVCVSPLYGNIPLRTLVQFVEFTRLLGAGETLFYASKGVSELLIKKLQCHYKPTNQISVSNWPIPVDDSSIWYHGQLLAINDCLYKNMYRFDYLVFLDLDEFLIPHNHPTWLDMVQHLTEVGQGLSAQLGQELHSTSDTIDAYSFQSAFFAPLLDGNPDPLTFDLESDIRVYNLSRVRTKVMVKPTHIYEVGIHHVSRTTNDVGAQVVRVNDQVAYVHHYRQCTTEYDNSIKCDILVRDNRVANAYHRQLTANIFTSLELIRQIIL
jgi:hypothetical protein